jgi:hypothetical protein
MSGIRATNITFYKTTFNKNIGEEDNIRMDHRYIGWEGVDWMHLDQDWDQWRTALNMVMNLRVP